MSYEAEFARKHVTPQEAAGLVRSGDWVHYSHFAMAPQVFDAALAARAEELFGVKVTSASFLGIPKVVAADPVREHFVFNDWHFSPYSRKLHDKDLCNYIPLLYHEADQLYKRCVQTDFFVVRVGAMDRNGWFNFGPSNSGHGPMARAAGTVIAEVSPNIPRCLGGSEEGIHISQVDYIIDGTNTPLPQVPNPPPTPADEAAARRVVGLIEDGACIQLGIGAMPNVVGKLIAQSDLRDLGGHTEILVDAYADMVEAGVMTNQKKSFDRGRIAYTFAMGTDRIYNFLDDNPSCASYPVHYVNNPMVAMKHDKLTAINNAVCIDLYGQVCSESVGTRQITGTGGQVDFIYAAFHSEGGKPIICLTARQEGGGSRIVPTLPQGSTVTLPRTMVQYVVTENGVVDLKGKTTWQRAAMLIELAHPDDREELIRAADKMRIWLPSNKR